MSSYLVEKCMSSLVFLWHFIPRHVLPAFSFASVYFELRRVFATEFQK